MIERRDHHGECGEVAPRRSATQLAAALSGAASFLGNRNPLAGTPAKDEAKNAIHEESRDMGGILGKEVTNEFGAPSLLIVDRP